MNDQFKLLKITPTDPLFFGGGKSFRKGESSWHRSRLLPYPSVFYGAISSVMLEKNPKRREDYLTKQNDEEHFRKNYKQYFKNNRHRSAPSNYLKIGTIYLYEEKKGKELDKNLYLPAPKDLFMTDYRIQYGFFTKTSAEMDCSLNDVSYCLKNPEGDHVQRVDGVFIDWITFIHSYFHNKESVRLIQEKDIITHSYKIGIARNDKMHVLAEHLYRLDMVEFHKGNWSYVVEYSIEDDWWEDMDQRDLGEGFLKLGGENKSCQYEPLAGDLWNKVYCDTMGMVNDWEYVKLMIKTPAIFKDKNWKHDLKARDIEVTAAVTAAPYSIGGFDMRLKRPKPMRNAIPEGCIYLLRSEKFIDKSFLEIKDIVSQSGVFVDSDLGFSQFEVLPLYEEQIGGV